ncbi:MAPEG family protein [Novosphingobium sp. MW5]|nr:MAPEG family protein [Novosphingobium sp. MW5]
MLTQILYPAATLIAWSLFMLVWMEFVRFQSIIRQKIPAGGPGTRGDSLEGILPDKVNWKAHNYNHLMEQPTIYYPLVIMISTLSYGVIDVKLAWTYTILRIIHSLWQSFVNTLQVRFILFIAYTIVLIIMVVRLLFVLA